MKTQDNKVQVGPIDAQATVMPTVEHSLSLFSFDDNGIATLVKDSKATVDDIVNATVHFAQSAKSATLKAVGVLRVARMLPPVSVVDGDKVKAVSAYLMASERIKTTLKSDSAWFNLQGLIEAADVVAANDLPVSPFVVKESLGYLRKAGAFKKDGDAVTLKLMGHDTVAKALKAGKVGVNSVREVVAKAKAAKPDTFPKEAAVAAAKAAAAKAQASKAPGATGGTGAAGVVAGGTVLTAEHVARDIVSVVGTWDKAVAQGVKISELRKATRDAVESLAKLAGFELIAIP